MISAVNCLCSWLGTAVDYSVQSISLCSQLVSVVWWWIPSAAWVLEKGWVLVIYHQEGCNPMTAIPFWEEKGTTGSLQK